MASKLVSSVVQLFVLCVRNAQTSLKKQYQYAIFSRYLMDSIVKVQLHPSGAFGGSPERDLSLRMVMVPTGLFSISVQFGCFWGRLR